MSSVAKRILLAEDNPNDAELTLTALQEQGLAGNVVVVPDGEEALDYLYRRKGHSSRSDNLPEVIIVDLKMPKVDGLEVVRQIKSDPALRSIPVVILTSSREERDLASGYQAGVNAYVVKPVDFEEFIDAVRQIGGFWARVNEPPPRLRA